MDAGLIANFQTDIGDDQRVEFVIWQLPRQLPGSAHAYKYRLAFIVDGVCVLRFDNEAGKGDHWHLGDREFPYEFTDVETLKVDFWTEVDRWLKTR